MSMFFDALRNELARTGRHAPSQCQFGRCPMCSELMELEDNWPPTVRNAVDRALSAAYGDSRWHGIIPFIGEHGMRTLAGDHDYAVCRLEDVIAENKALRAHILSLSGEAGRTEGVVEENKALRASNAVLRLHVSKVATELFSVSATLEKVMGIAQNINANVDKIDASMPKSDAHEAAFDSFGQPLIKAPCGRGDFKEFDAELASLAGGTKNQTIKLSDSLDKDVERVTLEYFDLLETRTRHESASIKDRDAVFCRMEREYDDNNCIYKCCLFVIGNYSDLTAHEFVRHNSAINAMDLSIQRFMALYGTPGNLVRFRSDAALVEFLIYVYRLFKIHYNLDLEDVQTHHVRKVLAEEDAFVRVCTSAEALERSKVRSTNLHKLFEIIVGKRRD